MTNSSVSSFNYFSLLGLSPDSSSDDLKKAFRREAKRWHPDLNKDNHIAALRFRWINEAYSVLKDPQKRLAWEVSGRPTFEISISGSKPSQKTIDLDQERSTNGDTSFSSAEKLLLLLVSSVSLFILNTFLL